MNTFLQDSSLLVGSPEEIKALACKESAEVLVVSDSHGAYASLFLILKQFGGCCDALIFCGDGICDIAKLVEDALCDSSIQSFVPPVIGIVEGNNDADLYPVKNPASGSPCYVEFKIPLCNSVEVCGHKIFFTHGHRNSLFNGNGEIVSLAKESGCEIALYGHTHVAFERLCSGGILALNPGSCSKPRGGQKPSFAVIALKKNSASFESTFFEISASGIRPFFPGGT